MRIVPAGKYQNALIRLLDGHFRPDYNRAENLYRLELNRSVDRVFVEGVATFSALANRTIVPWQLVQYDAEWLNQTDAFGEDPLHVGVYQSEETYFLKGRELERRGQMHDLIDQICEKKILSEASLHYITTLDLTSYPNYIVERFNEKRRRYERAILRLYVERLVHQIYTAPEAGAYLVIGESDIEILRQIGNAILGGKIETALPFPDLRDRIIDPDAIAHGILTFSPPDARALEYVRAQPEVRQYGRKIQSILEAGPIGSDDPSITDALIEAYTQTKLGRQIKNVLEVETWVVKPLHYVPVVGEILTIVDDVRDVADKIIDAKMKKTEWWMMSVRMREFAIENYLDRLSDNRHPSLLQYRKK